MHKAWAKQRVSSSSRTPVVVSDEAQGSCADLTEGDKFKDQQGQSWRRSAQYLRSLALRRWADAFGLSVLFISSTWSWVRTTFVLLEPSDAVFVRILTPVYHFVFICFVLSWLGAVYHGPGRVSSEEQCSDIPSALEAALACGQLSKKRSFGGSDGYCNVCCSWKPAMAHHCKICNKCSMWMDHHCFFVANCIGFRNTRCFIIFLIYTKVLVAVVSVISVRYIYLHPPADLWEWLVWAVWFAEIIVHNYANARYHLGEILAQINLGWPYGVMVQKFEGLLLEAKELERDLRHLMDEAASPEAMTEISATLTSLQKARADVVYQGLPVGIFYEAGGAGKQYVFGEPPSWLWFVPFRPGGFQDPLHPCIYDSKACAAWRQFGDAWKQSEQVLQRQRLLCLEWRERMARMASISNSKPVPEFL